MSSTSPKKEEGNRIYVSGYSEGESQEEVKQLFSKFGEIDAFALQYSIQQYHAYAKVSEAEEAVRADEKLNGKSLVVEIARAKKRDGICYNCGKQGHFARNCRKRSRSNSRNGHKKKKKKRRHHSSSSSSSSPRVKKRKSSKHKKRKRSSSSSSSSSSN